MRARKPLISRLTAMYEARFIPNPVEDSEIRKNTKEMLENYVNPTIAGWAASKYMFSLRESDENKPSLLAVIPRHGEPEITVVAPGNVMEKVLPYIIEALAGTEELSDALTSAARLMGVEHMKCTKETPSETVVLYGDCELKKE